MLLEYCTITDFHSARPRGALVGIPSVTTGNEGSAVLAQDRAGRYVRMYIHTLRSRRGEIDTSTEAAETTARRREIVPNVGS